MRGESPKALRVFFRHDQKLFAPVSSLIFSMISEFYSLVAGKPITSACVLSFQPFGDLLRANAHWHAIILEGGFDPDGMFFFLPIHNTHKLTECFRRRLIKFFLSKNLISENFASTLLCWKNSGFSVNNSVRIGAEDYKARVALAQYIARPPLSLAKLTYEPFAGKVIFHTSFNPALGENVKVWDALQFIALATQFIPRAAAVSSETARAPPQGVRLIHYSGLYSSRSRRCSCPP